MKQKLWIALITYLAYCIDKELYKAIDYLKTQVEALVEHQEKDKRILLNNNQRRRLARKAKALTRKLLEETTIDDFMPIKTTSPADCKFVGKVVHANLTLAKGYI